MSEWPPQALPKPIDLRSIVNEILPYDHPKLKERIKGASHVLEYELGDQHLVFFGAKHTNDPASPMLVQLQAKLDQFLKTETKERVVLMIEGMHGDEFNLEDCLKHIATHEDAVSRYGEKGLLLCAARDRGLTIKSPEAPEESLVQEMLDRGFEREEIALFLVLRGFTSTIGRQMDPRSRSDSQEDWLMACAREFYHIQELTGVTWIRSIKSEKEISSLLQDQPAFHEYITRVVTEFMAGVNAEFKRLPGMKKKLLIPSMKALLDRDQTQIPIKDVNAFFDPVDPRKTHSAINQISAAWNMSRDEYLVRQMARVLDQKKSIFIVFGGSHAIAIEPALEKLMAAHV
ncbi:hypothetical protein EXS71_01430 [Candidatus Uhrbacteria bacterium]|nr:hypothetical protein [Candidatus Uhrbacteria bacterium]